jgi:hypothetical protein
LYGVVIGFGLATKVTTAPLAFIPLVMLRTFRQRATFAATVVVALLLFTAPIWPQYPQLVHWADQVLSHQGSGGTGPAGGVPLALWATRVVRLALGDPILAVLVALGAAALMHGRALPPRTGPDRLLAGLVLCGIAQFMFAGLQPTNPHYLLASRATAGLLLWMILERAPRARAWATESRLRAAGVLAAVLLIVSVLPLWPREQRWLDAAAIEHELETRYPGAARVLYRGASSIAYPLQRGNWEAGSPYTDVLAARYPHTYSYHSSPCCTFRREPPGLFDWSGRRIELAELQQRYERVVFVGVRLFDEDGAPLDVLPDDDYPPSAWGPLPATLREVFQRGGEAIHEVVAD